MQTLGDRGWMPKIAAGWHICLDVADRMMAGRPLGRIVADEAKEHGWEELRDAYSAVLEKAKAGPAGKA